MAHPSLYERHSSHLYALQQSYQMPDMYTSNKKPKLSRLELMKQNYEKKRQKDFEEKLSELRAQQPRTDSGNAHSSGTVRAFFAERRAMEASKRGQQDPSSLPPIGAHFKKMKNNQGPVIPRTSQRKENKSIIPTENIHMTHDIHSGNRGFVKFHRKKSKGIDKQNLLPPLQRASSNTNIHKPPTPNRRYETHSTFESEDSAHKDVNQLKASSHGEKNILPQKDVRHVPQPPKKPKPSRTNRRPSKPVLVENEEKTDDEDCWSTCSNEPPPNLTKLKALRIKRLSQRKLCTENSKPEKPTEFQKWQIQQDEERQERLKNYRKKNHDDYSDNEEKVTLSMRERELLERIKAEQDKLSEIKKMQQELERQETIERENTKTPEKKILNNKEKEIKEEDYHEYFVQKHIQKPPTPAETAPEKPVQKETQEQLPVTSKKSKPKPQIVNQETVQPDQEPKDDFINYYEQAAKQDEEVELDLSPCSICGRNFATERLSKHEVVCLKNANSKRKKFDGQKQRIAGTDHEKYVLSGKHKQETPKAKRADWRVQHENFIKAIRYAKGSSDEPPPVTENPHYVACPYCERKFNPDTAERHIPRCKDIKARPAPPKADKQRKRR